MSKLLPSLAAYVQLYLDDLQALAYAKQTIDFRRSALNQFTAWCEDRSITTITALSQPLLQRYQRHLATQPINNSDKQLRVATQRNRLTGIKMWCKFLVRENYMTANPASELALPRLGKPLPQAPLTPEEVERLLSQPNLQTDAGIRDRAILETFYSTGIRRQELIHLTLHSIHYHKGIALIKKGKGNKDRFVAIGERALQWIEKYVNDVRPLYTLARSPEHLFLADTGQALDKFRLSRQVTHYLKQAGIRKTGSCHLLRHTLATLMLENGADLRYIQQQLGHAAISTTEIYTHVAIHKLKHIHTLTHPAKLPESEEVVTEEDLFTALDAEAAQDYH